MISPLSIDEDTQTKSLNLVCYSIEKSNFDYTRNLQTVCAVSNWESCSSTDSNICTDWKLKYRLKSGQWEEMDDIISLATTTTTLTIIGLIVFISHNLITSRSLHTAWSVISQYQTFLAFTLIGLLECKPIIKSLI